MTVPFSSENTRLCKILRFLLPVAVAVEVPALGVFRLVFFQDSADPHRGRLLRDADTFKSNRQFHVDVCTSYFGDFPVQRPGKWNLSRGVGDPELLELKVYFALPDQSFSLAGPPGRPQGPRVQHSMAVFVAGTSTRSTHNSLTFLTFKE
jgi:hypothetical protein